VNFASSTEMEFDGGDRSDDASERLLQIYMRASVCAARRENRYHRVPYSHIIISYICGSSPAVYIQYNFVPTPWPGGDTRYIRIYIPIIRVCIAVVMRWWFWICGAILLLYAIHNIIYRINRFVRLKIEFVCVALLLQSSRQIGPVQRTQIKCLSQNILHVPTYIKCKYYYSVILFIGNTGSSTVCSCPPARYCWILIGSKNVTA